MFAKSDNRQVKRLQQEVTRLKDQATKDPLTGLLNRRGFDEALEPIVGQVKGYLNQPTHARRQSVIIRALSLVFIDLDNFKPVNDKYGHAAGDYALTTVAQQLQRQTRSIDLVGRWGGDEFAVALLGAPAPEALKIADDIRVSIEAADLRFKHRRLGVTLSIGIAELTKNMDTKKLFTAADRALSKAKKGGRNQVVVV